MCRSFFKIFRGLRFSGPPWPPASCALPGIYSTSRHWVCSSWAVQGFDHTKTRFEDNTIRRWCDHPTSSVSCWTTVCCNNSRWHRYLCIVMPLPSTEEHQITSLYGLTYQKSLSNRHQQNSIPEWQSRGQSSRYARFDWMRYCGKAVAIKVLKNKLIHLTYLVTRQLF